MNWLASHTWAVPLGLTVLWLLICYGLLHVLTGGLAFSIAFFLLWSGTAFIWMAFGAFHLLRWLIWHHRLIE